MKQRLKYGYPIGAISVAVLVFGDFLLYIFISIFALLLLREFFQLTGLRTERKLFPMRRWGYLLSLLILTLVYFKLSEYLDLAIVVFIMAAFIYRMAYFTRKSDGFLRDLSISILGGIYIGGFMSFFFRLRELGIDLKAMGIIPIGNNWLALIPFLGNVLEQAGWTTGVGHAMHDGPNWLVILPIVGSWGYDFSAFFTGTLLGRTPLAPSISPKKSIEGMIGGLIGCGTATVLIARFIGIDSGYFLLLFIMGLVMGTFSQLGDLCISSIKREAGAKDSSAAIPGHGGWLDKCDGLLFVLPVSYYFIHFALLISSHLK